MRFVPVDSLVDGMVVAKNLYDKNQKLLLSKGSVVKDSYIQRIKQLGYQGVYITDDISNDIIIKDVIENELRMKTIHTLKDVFIYSKDNVTIKNFNKNLFNKKIETTKNLVNDIVDQLLNNEDAIVNLIDLKIFDDYTFFHSVNVAVLSVLIGVSLKLNKEELYNLCLAAVLHDIGKIFIDKKILNKNGKLTDEEYNIIQRHSEFGYHYLKETYQIPTASYIGVLQHHEKFDGSGYPSKICKEEISLLGRIICIADVYDALISNRPYRKALLPSEAMEYVMANGGVMFDIKLTKIFAKKVAPFPVGTYVQLSNGFTGIVAKNYANACMRPTVKLIKDAEGNLIEPIYINLRDDPSMRSVTVTGINNIN